MIWLVIGAVAPSFLIALAAGFMVRRLAPHIGLVDLPGGRKVHGSVTPLGGGLAIWLGVVGAFALGAGDPQPLDARAGNIRRRFGQNAAGPGGTGVERTGQPGRSARRGFALPLRRPVGSVGRSHHPDALGPGRRLARARLAAASGGAGRGGGLAGFRQRLAIDAVYGRAAVDRIVERGLDRGAGEFLQHARQHGRPVGRRGHDRGRAVGGGAAFGAESDHPRAATLRGRFFIGSGRRTGRLFVA